MAKNYSPNDLFLTATGDLYFTDPSYGFERPDDPKKQIALSVLGCW